MILIASVMFSSSILSNDTFASTEPKDSQATHSTTSTQVTSEPGWTFFGLEKLFG